MLKDDPDVIEAAAQYVRRYRLVPLNEGVPMPMSSAPGQHPGTAGATPAADGRDPSAPADMSAACEDAMSAAMSQREQEGRKAAMGMQPPS